MVLEFSVHGDSTWGQSSSLFVLFGLQHNCFDSARKRGEPCTTLCSRVGERFCDVVMCVNGSCSLEGISRSMSLSMNNCAHAAQCGLHET